MQQIAFPKLGSRYAWAVVGMLWIICFLNYADRQALSAIFPLLEQQFGFSKFQLGMIGSIFMWVYAATVFFAGFLSDHVSRKKLIIGGCFFWSLVTCLTGWSTLFWHFLTIRALEGLGESCYFPASNSLIADYHAPQKRSKALAFHQSGVYLGTIVGSSLGAWMAQHYGWQYGFYFFGGSGIVASLFLSFFLKEPPRAPRASITSSQHPQASLGQVAWELLRQPVILLLIMAFISANIVAAIFLTWMPTFLYEKFHTTLAVAGFLAVIFIQLASAVSAPCCGWMADRFSQKKKHGRVIVQMSCLLLGASTIVMVGYAPSLRLLMVALLFFGLCKGGYDAGIFSSLFDYIAPERRGAAAGLIIAFGWFGGALGPLIVGAITTYGGAHHLAMARMSATIAASAGAYILAALFLLRIPFLKSLKKL